MTKRLFATAVLAAAVAACAGVSSAAIYTVDFMIDATDANPWFGIGAGDHPFGLSSDPVLTGSFKVNDATRVGNSSGAGSISDLTYVTGTKTWSTSGLGAIVGYSGQNITGFFLFWDPQNYINSSNTAQVHDASTNQGLGCNQCVTFDVTQAGGGGGNVPEPASWALMISGFGLAGTAMRRRRALA